MFESREEDMQSHRLLRLCLGYVLFALVMLLQSPAAATIQIVAFGDSNTAGFGVAAGSKYPAKLERALRARGHDVVVRNRGFNGSTTRGGLARLNSAVPQGTAIAIVFFGRNDVRFGVPAARMRSNLDAIVGRLRSRGVAVILCGFYPFSFANIAARHGATYCGDFFAGIAVKGVKKQQYALRDIVPHLNAAGYSVVVRHLRPMVERAIRRVRRR
jgi:acyl-CoA thioesterase-1